MRRPSKQKFLAGLEIFLLLLGFSEVGSSSLWVVCTCTIGLTTLEALGDAGTYKSIYFYMLLANMSYTDYLG